MHFCIDRWVLTWLKCHHPQIFLIPAQQLLQAFPWDTAARYLLRDRDGNYGKVFRETAAGLGIEEVLVLHARPGKMPTRSG